MIRIAGKEIALVKIGAQAIGQIRKGAVLVWQAVRSCFGAGYWRGDKPWRGEEHWK